MTASTTRLRPALAALLLGLLLAACGGDDGGASENPDDTGEAPAATEAVTVVAKEFEFEPDSFSVPAGTDVEVVVDNQGVIEHDFVVEGFEPDEIYADAGTTASGTINLPAGEHTFYCSVPGHRESGMEGTVTGE